MGEMTAAHFIYIPAILLIGVVIGWILGSRAAADAFAVQVRRERDRATAPSRDVAREPREGRPR